MTKPTKQAHTPTPWKANGRTVSSSDSSICRNCLPNDAIFIVRACNSHEELLEACKYAHMAGPTKGVIKALEQAIAKAESPNG